MIKDEEKPQIQQIERPRSGGMQQYLAAHARAIPPSGIRRFFDLVSASKDKDIITLGVGEPDFVTPWRVRDAAVYSLEKEDAIFAERGTV